MRPDGCPPKPVPGLDSGETPRSTFPQAETRRRVATEGGGTPPEVRGGGRDTCAVDAGERLPAHGLHQAYRQGRVSRGAARPDPRPKGETFGAGGGGVKIGRAQPWTSLTPK